MTINMHAQGRLENCRTRLFSPLEANQNYQSPSGMDLQLFLFLMSIQEHYYFVLACIGIPANFVTIIILCRGNCGLSNSVTLYLVAMALSDLLVLAFCVIFGQLAYYHVKSLIYFLTQVCAFNKFLMSAFMDCSVWSTVVFTFDRFVAICHQGFKPKYCTWRTAVNVLATIWVVSILRSIPEYFKYEPIVAIDGQGRGCRERLVFGHLLEWSIYDWLNHFLTPLFPYLLILLLNCLTVKHILLASLARRRLVHQASAASSDEEMKSRRKSIVLLFAISAAFILLWLPTVIYFILDRVANLYYNPANFTHPLAIFYQCSIMLKLLSSCVNTFIYALTQTRFRKELWNGLTFPFTLLVRVSKMAKGSG
ncbi:probable G-protein coupled receptor 139 [Chiloscyllium plagiosum]|uniref:probable G-protein coupled receptor 139 n=1 Tax=Chiloscyllium plagiosum TaxID=36176 RepID=UPI001CB83EBD|nr:probable G-protein coupled receptor 139 [Chiloscyllium plagiosum]